jgi:hypothetical protein
MSFSLNLPGRKKEPKRLRINSGVTIIIITISRFREKDRGDRQRRPGNQI